MSLARPIDHTVFGSFDCGFIARENVSPALHGLVSDVPDPSGNRLLALITHVGGDDFTDSFSYPELREFHAVAGKPYNEHLHSIIYDLWGDALIHVTIDVTYVTAPVCGC
jgi:hypothetical protein